MLTERQLFLQYLGQTSYSPLLLEITRAEGVFMYGPGGETYLDLISGVSVSNTGHRHPRVVKAIKEQVDSYLHLMIYGELVQTPQVKYAEYLTGFLPPALNRVYFVNSGSEAVEGVIKLAKRYTGRSRIISFKNGYHGSTHGALSVQGSETYKQSFRPLLPDTWQIDFNNPDSLNAIDPKTACVIVEPIQAEAGVILPEGGFLKDIRERCSASGALLIYDEVQTGFGRTGTMFAIDRYGVIPDILVLAKALGGGMPLGAFISSGEIMSCLMSRPSLGHITTFGGHPVCCAAGLASMRVLSEEKLIESCNEKSDLFKKELKHKIITDVRGEGLLLAVTLSDQKYISYIISKAPEYGLLLDYFLFCNDSFRIAPPLTISGSEILWACKQLMVLLDSACENVKPE
jgi:acetylornithine/succinyldiaminopimelate/putrescine aminotransferase